jgi:hypothetical protein
MDVPTMLDIFDSYGFETDDEMTEDRKMEALNETYWDACDRNDWDFLKSSVSLSFDGTSGTPTNDPGDIGKVMTVQRLPDGITLEPWRMDDFYEQFGSSITTQSSPLLYFFEADQIKVYPIPSASETVRVKYISIADELLPTSLESDIRFPKRYHRSVLVIGTLAKLAVMQDDHELGQSFERLYEKALAGMIESVLKKQSQRPEFIHVNDPDNWDYS